MKTRWLVTVWCDVSPELLGPFATESERVSAARDYRAEHGEDAGGIYPLDIDGQGRPVITSYSGGFLDETDG